MYSVVDGRFFHRTPSRVECAPQPKPQPLAVRPVFEVVARLAAGPGHVGDLVLLVAGRIEPFHRLQIHVGRVIIRRERPCARAIASRSGAFGIDLEQ